MVETHPNPPEGREKVAFIVVKVNSFVAFKPLSLFFLPPFGRVGVGPAFDFNY